MFFSRKETGSTLVFKGVILCLALKSHSAFSLLLIPTPPTELEKLPSGVVDSALWEGLSQGWGPPCAPHPKQ